MKTGNKTRTGGLNQAEVDARVAALVQAAMLEANKGKAIRVDTGAAEVPQTGVVYYAPAPYNLYPGARMQRFAGTGAGANITLMASGAAKPLAMFGFMQTGGPTGNCVAVNFSQTTANGSGLSVTTSGGIMLFERGSNLDDADDSWDIIVVYIPA